MRTACIFLFNGRNTNHGADMSVAALDSHESPHEHQNINTVCLDAARPAIDLQTRRIENPALNALGSERSCKPKAIVTCFIANEQTLAVTGRCAQFEDQIRNGAASNPMNAWLVICRLHDGDDPALLAEFDCHIDRKR